MRESDVVADYQRALAAGDVDAIVATFESDGYMSTPANRSVIAVRAGNGLAPVG